MDSRAGSLSSGLGSNPGVGRRQTLKTFCPGTSSKLTQSIIKDHMVSHYKKVYSAKAEVDTSVPNSLLHSVKYKDQLRQERLRKRGRPLSANSFSQRTSRSSCLSAQSTLSVQYDDSPYLCGRSSIISSPRFTTSFNAKDVVYPSFKLTPHDTPPASKMKYSNPEAALQRKQSACSLAALRDEGLFKTFQDPVQKTYSGDLLQKHSQRFTQDKPFTPKILKSDQSSYLSKYRYYRTPQRKPTQDYSDSKLMRQETYHASTRNKEHKQELNEPSQGYSTDRDWSEDEVNDSYLSPSVQKSSRSTSRECYLYGSSTGFSPAAGKSPTMCRVSAEEEELKYLEFISAVTEDILSRAHISNRVLERVMKRHIDMNLHHLNESKMRHLLELLRKDFEAPTNIATSGTETEKRGNEVLDTLFSHLGCDGKQSKTIEDCSLFPYVSLIKHGSSSNNADPFMVSTPSCSHDSTTASPKINEKDYESDYEGRDVACSLHNADLSNEGTGDNEEDLHQIDTPRNDAQKNSDLTQPSIHLDGQSKDLDDLGESLASLHMSSNTHSETVEPDGELDTNKASFVSDDEF
ncbi:spermatogenesis-associated protein 7 homolog isoform X2 [Cololabis saira]|uniref:spermatogenesis-associated protein 7 homolog isoform X2 n=1 Tax=Cololabis saira TaxID=129043 RepID=UPI002AD29AEC|nr:spermatogenesis-associated protein 7 homolog isoform X2 [Cololabis saira]